MELDTAKKTIAYCEVMRGQGHLLDALEVSNKLAFELDELIINDASFVPIYVECLISRVEIHFSMANLLGVTEDLFKIEAITSLVESQKLLLGHFFTRLGSSYEHQGDVEKTISCWKKAVECFEGCNPPANADIVTMANNLGFAMKAGGELNLAEDYFLKALEIAHHEYGQIHERTAAISSNLGGIYFAGGFHDQAKEMHDHALDIRREIFGEEHPETAQSYNNMALVNFYKGEWDLAKNHFSKAFAAYEALGTPFHDELDAVADNFCAFYRHLSDEESARGIEIRKQLCLSPASS